MKHRIDADYQRMRSNDAKNLTKVAVTFHPPSFKFEYTKGNTKSKYHKKFGLADLINEPIEKNRVAKLSQEIADMLVERHNELLQISQSKIVLLIRRLLTAHINDKQLRRNPIQLSMSIKGTLAVSPLREKPQLHRHIVPISDVVVTDHKSDIHYASHSTDEKERLSEYGNLNKASDDELQAAKDEMTNVFEKYLVMPGDPEYVFDKRVDFEADEESSWD